jgi:hypothetical protein
VAGAHYRLRLFGACLRLRGAGRPRDRALVRDAFATLPGEWTADQIRSFHDLFDTLTPTAAIPGFRTKREQFLDRLRRLPSRADIHDLELRLGERMDSLAVRFDRAFDPHLS